MPTRTTKRPPTKATTQRLSRYLAKRDLKASGEPGGRPARATKSRTIRSFVIQKHDASRLHYDFRLEMDGVLRSWAVPKGLPVKPGERVLAVEVEDHPLSYGGFEGTIPAGNYGAGTVMLWDRGSYTVADGEPEAAYRKGKIHLALAGQKCVGEWTLVRMRPRAGDKGTNWLLLKNSGPKHAAAMTGAERDLSVASGRTLAEIAETAKPANTRRRAAVPQSAPKRSSAVRSRVKKKVAARAPRRAAGAGSGRAGAIERATAEFVPPMKALSADSVPEGDWKLEIKFDGFRAIAVIEDGRVELWSRNRKTLTEDYPEVVTALSDLSCESAVIDGEIVALDDEGRSRFQLLQGRSLPGARPRIVFYAFDLLQWDGRSFLGEPLETRQSELHRLIGRGSPALKVSTVFEMDPAALLAHVQEQGLEGIIAKAAGSRYEPDRRSGTWLKVKVHGEQEFVIGGYTEPQNSRTHFGALLVGYYDGGKLLYAGKVGTGFNQALLGSLHAAFQKHRVTECPFANLPTSRSRFGGGMTQSAMREVTWLKPELVAQVRFTEWTNDGMLRHPVFLGLREDKNPREVVREGPVAKEPQG